MSREPKQTLEALRTLMAGCPPTDLAAVLESQDRDDIRTYFRLVLGQQDENEWPTRVNELHRLYSPEDGDTFIVTYPRSGTTWMQMLMYQLTTAGDMNIPHIAARVPWFERQVGGPKVDLETMPKPRVFKTHLPYDEIPQATCARYIVVIRDLMKVFESCFHHFVSMRLAPNDVDAFADEFLRGQVQSGGRWCDHVAAWLENSNDLPILYVRYEDLHSQLEVETTRIAKFCGIEVDEALMARVRERCSLDYMKKHEMKFEHRAELAWEKSGQFIRSGRIERERGDIPREKDIRRQALDRLESVRRNQDVRDRLLGELSRE